MRRNHPTMSPEDVCQLTHPLQVFTRQFVRPGHLPKWTTKHNCHRIRAAAALPRFSLGTLARRLMLPKVMVWINAHECFLQKKFYMTWSEAKVYCILLDVLRIQILRPLDAWTPYCKSLCKSWSQRWFFVQILVVKLEKILYLFKPLRWLNVTFKKSQVLPS